MAAGIPPANNMFRLFFLCRSYLARRRNSSALNSSLFLIIAVPLLFLWLNEAYFSRDTVNCPLVFLFFFITFAVSSYESPSKYTRWTAARISSGRVSSAALTIRLRSSASRCSSRKEPSSSSHLPRIVPQISTFRDGVDNRAPDCVQS